MSLGADEAAQAFERSCCMIQGIAVSPEHRREGIGLRVKRYCDLWVAQHDACLVLSIPTNDAARHMNEKAGYDVLPPQVACASRSRTTTMPSPAVSPSTVSCPTPAGRSI